MLALIVNIDSVSVTEALWREPTLRQALIKQAELEVARAGECRPGAGGIIDQSCGGFAGETKGFESPPWVDNYSEGKLCSLFVQMESYD